jgi:hypothetical protein
MKHQVLDAKIFDINYSWYDRIWELHLSISVQGSLLWWIFLLASKQNLPGNKLSYPKSAQVILDAEEIQRPIAATHAFL